MASSQEILSDLYNKITVLEMVEKLKACGLIWSKVSSIQFRTTIQKNNDVWDVHLTKVPGTSSVVMDLRKNMVYYRSINSEDDPNLLVMYQEVEGDDSYDKDKALMRDVQQIENC